MGSAWKAIKRTFIKFVAIVAVVYLCAVGLAALAPGLLSAIAGVSAAGGAFAAAASAVSATMFSTGMLITFGVTTYLAYSGDKEAAEAREQLEKEAEAAQKQSEEHFLDMEEDRYQDYDGPAIGITWPRDVEEEFENIGVVKLEDEEKSPLRFLLPAALVGGLIWAM